MAEATPLLVVNFSVLMKFTNMTSFFQYYRRLVYGVLRSLYYILIRNTLHFHRTTVAMKSYVV